MWGPGDVEFDLDPKATEHPVVTARFSTPAGVVLVMAEVDEDEARRTLILTGAHIQSEAGPHAFGIAHLRLMARVAMERLDYDEIIISGAVRTTGANPGRRPRPLRFTRRDRHQAGD